MDNIPGIEFVYVTKDIVTGDSVGCSGHVVNGRSMERFERSWPVELSGTGSGKRLHCRLSLKH